MFLALREIRHAKLRFALITGVIVMVSSLVFILSGLANGLSAGNTAAIDALPADGLVVSAGSGYLLDRSLLSATVAPTIRAQHGISAAEPFGVSSANIEAKHGDKLIGVSFFGVVPDGAAAPTIERGAGLGARNGVVIDVSLTKNGIHLGDSFTVEPGGAVLTVVGVTSGQTYRLAPVVFMPLDDWRALQPKQAGVPDDAVSAILVRGDRSAIDAIPGAVPNTLVGDKSQIANRIPGESAQNNTLLLIQIFLVVIGAGIIAAFFYIITLQKMRELGVMKAIGAGASYLAGTLIAQVLGLALVGVLLGISVADTLGLVIRGAVPYSVTTQRMALFGGLLLLVAVGGAVLSLTRIARVDPLDAINKAG